jgi:UDP:flavonoid glycosyltransferase YjiC (YdhE family)
MAVAIGLKQRGHHPLIATAEVYRNKIEAEGIDFAPVRPDIGAMADNKALLEKIWDPKNGTKFLLRDYILPALEQSFEDLLPVCRDADLLLTHAASYGGPIAAEVLHLRWLSVALQPMAFLSRYDPPVLPPARWLRTLEPLGPGVVGPILALGKRSIASWAKPIVKLRQRLGLPAAKGNPMFEGQFSPFGTLALFSGYYAKAQPDWPVRTRITGFPFYDQLGVGLERWQPTAMSDAPGLARFLAEGPPPVLFTLGSSAVMHPGSFYHESLEAAKGFGIRAILLAGALPKQALGQTIPDSVHIASYAPYSEVMPLCAASVHQGGIGTTAQALRSGKPMIVVPWAHDQPDNAARIEKLGCGRTIPRNRYTAARVGSELESLLRDGRYAERAHALGSQIAQEQGIENACSAIDEFLADRTPA